MQIQNFLIRRLMSKRLILAVTALTMAFSVSAQEANISLPLRELTSREVFDAIESQTNYVMAVNKRLISNDYRVKITKSPITVSEVIGKILENTDMTYMVQGRDIIIYQTRSDQSQVSVAVLRNVAGTVVDGNGQPMEGVNVEILDVNGAKATTLFNGRFSVQDIPAGTRIAKLTLPDGNTIRYREVVVPTGGDTDVSLIFGNERMELAEKEQPATPLQAPRTTAYFVPNAVDHTIRAFSDEARSEYTFIPTGQVNEKYYPKFAIKTNLLYLATTTPNIALEFGLAPKWTLDVAIGLNPWTLNSDKGGIRHGLIQPELRYWFCQRFEKHFIGLHGIYGEYQIQNIDLAPFGNDLTGRRYDGWGAGAGISYGYHLPMGKRWAWEFTVGAGYIYLDYDKYNCGECDNKIGNRNKHYFGPTKAGVSLIFMIK